MSDQAPALIEAAAESPAKQSCKERPARAVRTATAATPAPAPTAPLLNGSAGCRR